MIEGLVGSVIFEMIKDVKGLCEIRLRAHKALVVTTIYNERIYPSHKGVRYIVSQRDIDGIILRATNMSLYSAQDEIIRGYIPIKCYRMGIAGEGVMDGDRLVNVKNISFLVIRIPHEIKGIADGIIKDFDGGVASTLVISPTGGGKTTLLRELARVTSYKFSVVAIDERYELCAMSGGLSSIDIGEMEVISGIKKTIAYEQCIRAMNPDVIVTDEVFCKSEVDALVDIIRCGVKVFASVHGKSVDSIAHSDLFRPLLDAFDYAVALDKNPVGRVVEKVWL